MLRLLWRWLLGQRQNDRDIFQFWDGSALKWADPITIHRKLGEAGGDWEGLVKSLGTAQTMQGRKDLSPAIAGQMNDVPGMIGELAEIVRKAFDCSPLTTISGKPVGLTDTECLGLLTAFLTWLRGLEAEYFPLSHSPRQESPSPSASEQDTGEWSRSTLPETGSA